GAGGGAGVRHGRGVRGPFPGGARSARELRPSAVRREGQRTDLLEPARARAGHPSRARHRRVTAKRGTEMTENTQAETPAGEEMEVLDKEGVHASSSERPRSEERRVGKESRYRRRRREVENKNRVSVVEVA